MMNKPTMPYAVGEKVSVEKWDSAKSFPALDIGSPATVVKVTIDNLCGSGLMYTLRGSSGREVYLDSDWITPINP